MYKLILEIFETPEKHIAAKHKITQCHPSDTITPNTVSFPLYFYSV